MPLYLAESKISITEKHEGFFSIILFLLSKIKAIKHTQTDVCFLLRLGWGNEKEHGVLLLIKK